MGCVCSPQNTEWEYKVDDWSTYSLSTLEEYLNKFGADGWELVSTIKSKDGAPSYLGPQDHIRYYFKRPKRQQQVLSEAYV